MKSGHPLDTTLGNTVRSLLYARLIEKLARVETQACAAGDDLVIFCRKGDGGTLLKAAREFYATPDTRGPHMLGQVAKILELTDISGM